MHRRLRWGVLIVISVIALFILFCCSGLIFPMWDPAGSLNARLSMDMGLTLPAGANVTRGARQAHQDPSEFFVVEMPPADAAAFIEKLRTVAEVPTITDPKQSLFGRPAWWTPESLQGTKALQVNREHGFYRWFYAESSGTIYVAYLAV